MEKILISACLVGRKVRYDAKASKAPGDWVDCWRRQGRLVPLCPELAGGLSVPRPAAEIVGGEGKDVLSGLARLRTEDGVDVTDAFIAGATQALEVARREGIRVALLKARSPSCGAASIYDGTFSGTMRSGSGVTAALLRDAGIFVFSEEDLDEAAQKIRALEARRDKNAPKPSDQ